MMAACSRGGGRAIALLRGSATTCSGCARLPRPAYHIFHRSYAEAATISAQAPTSTPISPAAHVSANGAESPVTHGMQTETMPSERGHYRIKAGLILTRPPLLTRSPTSFESAFYLYQKRLNERLSAPFRGQYYFKQDTPAQMDFRLKIKERHGVAARDIGRYNPRGRLGWNDEVLVNSPTSDPARFTDKLVADAEMRISEDGEPILEEEIVRLERPLSRRTEADEKNDVRRLDRALDETLYLVVKRGNGDKEAWVFPNGDVPTHEGLHETATRVLAESAGVNMNTWLVGRHPVAFYKEKPVLKDEGTVERRGEKVFFLKGRIMAGQADLTNNKHGLTDFKWLTKSELAEQLSEEYFACIQGMLADR